MSRSDNTTPEGGPEIRLTRRRGRNVPWMNHWKAWMAALFMLTSACVPGIVEPPTPFSASETGDPPTREQPTVTSTAVAEESASPPEPNATERVALPARPVLEPRLEAGQPVVIKQIRMDSAADGWAIGEHPDPQLGLPIHVLTTADGGETWREVTPPEDPTLLSEVGGFYSAGSRAWVIYLGTDRVWRTTDGGASWTASEAGYAMGQYSALEFTGPQQGWMLQEVESGMGSQLVALFRTTDGGDTWREIIDPYDSEDLQSCRKTGMSFFGTETGWTTYNCDGTYLEAFLDVSGDAGDSWDEGRLPLPEGAAESTDQGWCYSGSPRPNSERSGSLIVTCVVAESSTLAETSYLYRTQDAGASWEMLDYPGGELQFFAEGTMLALGTDQYRSTDGGANWTKIKSVIWDGDYSFVNSTTGWAVARNEDEIALVRTTDGAATWEIIEPRIASN